MKKLFAPILLLLLLLAVCCVYFFIPGNLIVNSIASFQCSASGANRVITQKESWKQFWDGKAHVSSSPSFTQDDFFIHNNDTFRVNKLLQNAVSIEISEPETDISTMLQILSLPNDSTALSWGYTLATSLNPFVRIQQYQQAVRIKKSMTAEMNSLKNYLSKNETIYGLSILRTSTVDTFLISTKAIFANYPGTDEIYSLIHKLQAYAKENNALQTGYPMLNITQTDAAHFAVMTALPVNKPLPENGDIIDKRMIRGGFLTATVTGGRQTVENANKQMKQYFQDYRHTAMAIPFMYLITDRSQEKDSDKWVTKLYFPVM